MSSPHDLVEVGDLLEGRGRRAVGRVLEGAWARSRAACRRRPEGSPCASLDCRSAWGPSSPSPSSASWAACWRSSGRRRTSTRSRSTRCGSPATSRRTATRSSTSTRTRSARRCTGSAAARFTRLATGASRASSTATCSTRRSASTRADQAVLAILLLRGPQTPGELKGRAERLHPFASLDEVEARLGSLDRRELVGAARAPPGPEGARATRTCWATSPPTRRTPARSPSPVAAPAGPQRRRCRVAPPPAAAAPPAPDDGLPRRLSALEEEVAALRAELGGAARRARRLARPAPQRLGLVHRGAARRLALDEVLGLVLGRLDLAPAGLGLLA